MTSQSFFQNGFIYPDTEEEPSKLPNEKIVKKQNVYDAVAGKISTRGFIPQHLKYASTRDTPSSSAKPVPPEMVLFRHPDAPTRYQESDVYFANERNSVTTLPESDLLKALHSYISDFYSKAVADGGTSDWRSMDETALLAIGILMEETSKESLGRTGDLAFTEGEEIGATSSNQNQSRSVSAGRQSKRRRMEP